MISSFNQDRICNCKKSNCLKLYCDCFAAGAYCTAERCNCVECLNNFQFEDQRRSAILSTLDRNPNAFRSKIVNNQREDLYSHQKGCHCKRSNCLKKYCECFQGGIYCSETCRCKLCQNYLGSEIFNQFSQDELVNNNNSSDELSNDEDSSSNKSSDTITPISSASNNTNRSLSEIENILNVDNLGEICKSILSSALTMNAALCHQSSSRDAAVDTGNGNDYDNDINSIDYPMTKRPKFGDTDSSTIGTIDMNSGARSTGSRDSKSLNILESFGSCFYEIVNSHVMKGSSASDGNDTGIDAGLEFQLECSEPSPPDSDIHCLEETTDTGDAGISDPGSSLLHVTVSASTSTRSSTGTSAIMGTSQNPRNELELEKVDCPAPALASLPNPSQLGLVTAIETKK